MTERERLRSHLRTIMARGLLLRALRARPVAEEADSDKD